MSLQRSQEAERPQGQQATSSQQASELNDYEDDDSELDYEAFRDSDEATNLLLFSSVETYRHSLLIQHEESTVRANLGMRCIFQVLSRVQSPECNAISSTSYINTQRTLSLMYDRTSSSGLMEVDREPPGNDNRSNREERGDNPNVLLSLNTTMSIFSRDISDRSDSEDDYPPVQNRRGYRHDVFNNCSPPPKLTIVRRRLRSDFKMPTATASATQVANRVIKYARCIQNKYENEMCCPTCGLFPSWPVTGSCGHTRCITCTELTISCPCGKPSSDSLHINILIRDIEKNAQETKNTSSLEEPAHAFFTPYEKMAVDDSGSSMSSSSMSSVSQFMPNLHTFRTPNVTNSRLRRRLPMSSLARYNQGLGLLMAGKYSAAAPHIALAAASYAPDLRGARTLLAQCITIMSRTRDPRSLTKQLNHLVRDLSSTSWVKPNEMECILCCETFTNPVTTPCGHMFCRTCLERTLDYRKRCPLCLRPLDFFNLAHTGDTQLVHAALKSVNLVNEPEPLEPDFIPIFVCTVAYPSVPCPLFIFDPRYWLMIRRVLESGSRKFGMVACDRGKSYVDYGTILEVRDCVPLEDGRSILSTIGLSRFKVIERGVRDGCEVARIIPITDIPLHDVDALQLKVVGERVLLKALVWIKTLNLKVKADIESAFGRLCPLFGSEGYTPDGPPWLWWLIAVLPLRSEIKVLMLSTTCLLKRMLAVSRTLEAVDQVTLTTATTSECQLRRNYGTRGPPMLHEISDDDVS